jgi:hypothetical protein
MRPRATERASTPGRAHPENSMIDGLGLTPEPSSIPRASTENPTNVGVFLSVQVTGQGRSLSWG